MIIQMYVSRLILYFVSIIAIQCFEWNQCGIGSYQGTQSNSCLPCNQTCGDCYQSIHSQSQQNNSNNNICLTCNQGYFYNSLSNQCELECPVNTRKNTVQQFCEPCSSLNCKSCDANSSICTECLSNFILLQNQCLFNSEYISQEEGQIEDISDHMNEMECGSFIDSYYYDFKNQIQWQLFDQDNNSLFIITTYTVYKYDINTFQLLAKGSFPYNGFVRNCGFYPPDKVNFYCTARPNFLIQYNRNTLEQNLVIKFSGVFGQYSFFSAHAARLNQKYNEGRIHSSKSDGIEIYEFATNKIRTFSIPNFTQLVFNYLNFVKAYLLYDQAKDNVYFKIDETTHYLFLTKQTGTVYSFEAITPEYLLIHHRYGGHVCSTSLLTKTTPTILNNDCVKQNIPPSLSRYALQPLMANFENDKIFVAHQYIYGLLLIYDYQNIPVLNLVVGKLNSTLSYNYIGQRQFILLNFNHQISLLTVGINGLFDEKFYSPLTQYIYFLMSYGTFILEDKIILTNAKQAFAISYNLKDNQTSGNNSIANFKTFLDSDQNNFQIKSIFGYESILNFDFPDRIFYDSSLSVYIYIKHFQIRLKYDDSSIKQSNEIIFELEQNSGYISDAEYIYKSKVLVLYTQTEQIILSIPDLKMLKRDRIDILPEKSVTIYQKDTILLTCVWSKYLDLKYLYTDLTTYSVYVSELFPTIQDFFIGYNKLAILNNTEFIVITLSTNKQQRVQVGFSFFGVPNFFFQFQDKSYLTLYQTMTPPNILIYNMDQLDFSIPELTVAYPNVKITSSMLDYYNNKYSLYTIQSDGIYTYELNEANIFIQKSSYMNVVIQTFKIQNKVQKFDSFTKVIVYQPNYGVVLIDKITKQFQIISTQLAISNVQLLINPTKKEEVLTVSSLSQTVAYIFVNDKYRVIANIQANCFSLKYLDTSQLQCVQTFKNDTSLIPINNFKQFELSSYPTITKMKYDYNNQLMIVIIDSKILKILKYNIYQEQEIMKVEISSGTIDYLFYDLDSQILLYSINQISIYSMFKPSSKPNLILEKTPILWFTILQDKKFILLYIQNYLYLINYSSNNIIFEDNVLEKLIIANSPIISYDRKEDSFYLLFDKQKIMKYSFNSTVITQIYSNLQEIYFNVKRNDGNIFVLYSSAFSVYKDNTSAQLDNIKFTNSTDIFSPIELSKEYIFVKPSSTTTSYFININTLVITQLTFRAALFAVSVDINNNKVCSLTVDNILTIQDIFQTSTTSQPVFFFLQEFADDFNLIASSSGANTSKQVNMIVNIDMGYVIVSFTSYIYIYSLQNQSLLHAIRQNTLNSVLDYWNIKDSTLLYYDQKGIYFYDLHSILQMQSGFYSPRYKLNEINVQEEQQNIQNSNALIECIYTRQLKVYNIKDGSLLSQNQLRKTYFKPILINLKIIQTMFTANKKIIIRQNFVYVIDSQNQIIDSLKISEINTVGPLVSYILENNIIYILDINNSVYKIDLNKRSFSLSISLNSQVSSILEFSNCSLIFQYDEQTISNYLTCFDKQTFNFIELTSSLISLNLSSLIKQQIKINDSSFLISTFDGSLYQATIMNCQLQETKLLLSQQIVFFYYEETYGYLFVQRKGSTSLELFQNNVLVQTQIYLPSYKTSQLKLSDDLQYIIIYSELYIQIYSAIDLKQIISIKKLFMISEIQDVIMLSSDFIIVTTNTDLFTFHIIQNKYFLNFSYSVQMPKILFYSLKADYIIKSLSVFVDISIISQQGFIQLHIPISLDMKQSTRQCFYSLDLDSKNQTKNPLISEKIELFNFLNLKTKNLQTVNSVNFNIGQDESLSKLSSIPSKIPNLILDSISKPNQSKILVDKFFNNINSVSTKIFLSNSVLYFNEMAEKLTQSLLFSEKELVFLQNINFEGFRQCFKLIFQNNNYIRIENLNILDLTFISNQNSDNKEILTIFQIEQVDILQINYLHIRDLTIDDSLVLFTITQTKKIIIKNIIIENITCKQLTIFSIDSSNSIEVANITLNNINCDSIVFMHSILVTNIVFTNASFTSITSNSFFSALIFQATQNLTINSLDFSMCTGLNILKIYKYVYDDTIYTVKNVNIENFKITKSSALLPQTSNRLLQIGEEAQSIIEMVSINDCQILTINNFSLDSLTLHSQNFLSLYSSQISLNSVKLNQINSSANKLSQILISANSLTIEDFVQTNSINLQVEISNTGQLDLTNLRFNNNSLQVQQAQSGLLSLSNIHSANISESDFSQNTLSYPSKGVINFSNVYLFKLINTSFQKNQAINSGGSSLYITNTELDGIEILYANPSLINNCRFIENYSFQEQGGAIYVSEQNIVITNSIFQKNKALIGGAIKVNSITILPQFFTDSQQGIQNGNTFIENSAELYGGNIGYFPQSIKVTKQNDRMFYQNGEQVIINNFQSSKYIDDIVIEMIDAEGKTIKFPSETLMLNNLAIQQEFLKYHFAIEQKEQLDIFVSQSQVTLSNYEYFKFNATIMMAPSSTKQITVKSIGTLPLIQIQNGKYTVIQDFPISITSMGCQVGDYFQKINSLTYCLPCPSGQYSLDTPNLTNKDLTISCKFCPSSAVMCEGSTIQLKNGYWRQDNFTDDIYSCSTNHISSCKAEDPTSINLCSKGYIGPLCSICDTLGQTWGERYAESGNECSICAQPQAQPFIILGFFLLTAVYISFIVFQNIRCSQKKILQAYTQNIIGISLGCGIDITRNSVLIKIIMNFLQIYLILDGAGFQIPQQVYPISFAGDPYVAVVSSIDCVLKVSDVKQLIFSRILLKLLSLTALFLISVFGIIIHYKLDPSKSKKFRYQIIYLNMAFKTIFIYGGFGIVSDAVKAMTCVKIGTKNYRLLDKRIECSSELGQDVDIYIFSSALIIIITIIIPVSMLIKMRKILQEKRQESIEVIKNYNFLFQEYKVHAMYWEIVKIMLKYFIIFVITFFEQDQISKVLLTLMFLLGYTVLQIKIQPYKNKSFNKMDLYSIFTCQITLLNAACILSSHNAYIQNVLIALTILINFLFLMNLILFFIKGLSLQIYDEKEEFKNPFLLKVKQCLVKMQPILQFRIIKSNSKSLKFWFALKKKIIGRDGYIFIEYLQKTVNENKLVLKQFNNLNQSGQIALQKSLHTSCSQFKIMSPSLSQSQASSPSKLLRSNDPKILRKTYYTKSNDNNSNDIQSFNFTNGEINYPTMADEVKKEEFHSNKFTLMSQDNIISTPSSNKHQIISEGQDECYNIIEDSEANIQMYQSKTVHKASNNFKTEKSSSKQN